MCPNKRADYVLSLKVNQGTLYEDVKEYFEDTEFDSDNIETYGDMSVYGIRIDKEASECKTWNIRFFDSGNKPSDQTEPERFYHGFVPGMMVELSDRYRICSNRESGSA